MKFECCFAFHSIQHRLENGVVSIALPTVNLNKNCSVSRLKRTSTVEMAASAIDGVFNNTYGLKQSELDEINASFHEFDRDNNGHITRDELKQCLKRFEHHCTGCYRGYRVKTNGFQSRRQSQSSGIFKIHDTYLSW